MALNEKTLEQNNAYSLTSLEEAQRSFERQQETYVRKIATFQEHCQSLLKQANGFGQERLLLEQSLLSLWEDFQAERQLRSGDDPPTRSDYVRERMQMRQNFSDAISHQRQSFSTVVQTFHERLAALREQRACLKALTDRMQQQEGYRQLQAIYLEIQRELQEYCQLLREQKTSYSQLRLNYEDEQRWLRAQKSAI